MSERPPKWADVALEELLEHLEDGRLIHQGWSPQCEKEASDDPDVWGVLKTTAVQAGVFLEEHNKRLPDALEPRPLLEVRPGDLIVTSAGPRARCGIPCLIRNTRPRLMLSGKMYRFRVNDRLVGQRYLEAYLLSPRASRAINGMKTGISDSGVNLTHGRFRKLQVPLSPLNEQRRIVAAIEQHLSRLDAADASLVSAKRKLGAVTRATLADAAAGHDTVALGLVTTGHRYGTSVKCTEDAAGPAVLRIPNIRNGRIILEGLKYATSTELGDCFVEEGDLLVIRTNGSRDLIGRVGAVDGASGMAFASYLIRVRPTAELDPKWAVLALTSPRLRSEIEACAASTAGQYNLNLAALRSLEIPLPSLEEQRRIVTEVEQRLSAIDALRDAIERARRRSAALRRSVLERAFRGELVPQDPTDEPASVLLERIAAERAAKPAQARRSSVRR